MIGVVESCDPMLLLWIAVHTFQFYIAKILQFSITLTITSPCFVGTIALSCIEWVESLRLWTEAQELYSHNYIIIIYTCCMGTACNHAAIYRTSVANRLGMYI